jgi:hypothetical protein
MILELLLLRSIINEPSRSRGSKTIPMPPEKLRPKQEKK